MPFQKGNKLGKGNRPQEGIELRNDLIMRVRKSKREINEALIKQAMEGNTQAIREVYDRTVGKSKEFIDVTSDGKVLPTPILNVLFNNNGDHKDTKAL